MGNAVLSLAHHNKAKMEDVIHYRNETLQRRSEVNIDDPLTAQTRMLGGLPAKARMIDGNRASGLGYRSL